MPTINSTISAIGIGEHNVLRGGRSHLGRKDLPLLSLLDKKGNETTLEVIDYGL